MRPLSALSLVLAFGLCAFGQYPSHLAINVSHSGHFLQGQTNAFYLIRVSNPGHAWSHGSVLVTDHAQSGLEDHVAAWPGLVLFECLLLAQRRPAARTILSGHHGAGRGGRQCAVPNHV